MIDYESKVQQVYEAVLRPGMGAIDVGAHVGRHSMEMLRCVSPGGRVMMFEPLPDLFSALSARIAEDASLSSIGEVHPFALSDTTGATEFCVAVDAPGFSGMRERKYDVPTRVQRISVDMRRLDDVVNSMRRVDFIKIDTEGAEWHVLKGAMATIERHRPVITFEFGANSYQAFDVDPFDVHRALSARNYAVLDILGRRLGEEAFAASSVHQAVWDYIAVPLEKHSRLGFERQA